MNKNIVILCRMDNSNYPFCSYVYNHAKELAKLGNNVTAIIFKTFFPFIKRRIKSETIYVDGIKIIYCNVLGFSNLLYNSKINLNGLSHYFVAKKQIKKILKEENIDLIDAHYFKEEGYAAGLLAKKYHLNTFVTLHGTSINRNINSKNGVKQIKKISKYINKFICVSKKIYNQLDCIDIKNKMIIYNGIMPLDVKRENHNYNICTIGNLIDSKNIDIVIRAFSNLSDKYSKSKLYIIGDGPLKNKLMELARELKVDKKVVFTGFISSDKVYEILSSCNVFALISKPEGFGIAYCEAMYCGCISIGTRNEGIDGYIVDGENGFLIDCDVNQLKDKIEYIFNNNCDKIRNEGIRLATKTTWERNAQNYLNNINE